MKTIFFLIALLFISANVRAGNIYEVKYDYQADVKVKVVDYDYQADLLVYITDYDYQATGKDQYWFFTKYDYQADTKVYFVDYDYQADVKIFYVKYDYQAKWNNSNKYTGRFKK